MPTDLKTYIHAYRGDFIEDVHAVSLAIVNPAGDVLFRSGNPELRSPMRSSAKPFQALALFASGAYQKFNFSLKELALACASHEGSHDHLDTAKGMLAKLELDESSLNCGAHLPGDALTRKELLLAQQAPSSIHNNCSGKHSGMLAVAKALGVTTQGYEKRDHAVQELIFEAVQELAGLKHIDYAIDGCSLPTFIMPLSAAARMWVSLADLSTAPKKYQEGLKTVFQAMQAHPDMIAAEGAIDTLLMQTLTTLAAKRGAQGYYAMALTESPYGPLGIALKVEDGSNEARDVFVVKLLEFLGVLSPATPLPWRDQVIKNHRAIVTGRFEAGIEREGKGNT